MYCIHRPQSPASAACEMPQPSFSGNASSDDVGDAHRAILKAATRVADNQIDPGLSHGRHSTGEELTVDTDSLAPSGGP